MDRAAATASAVVQIVTNALRRWLVGDNVQLADVRIEIERLLRDEFAEVQQTTFNEIRREDE